VDVLRSILVTELISNVSKMGTKADFAKETAILPTEMLLIDYFKCGNHPQ
jgi:hypothetical protein